MSHSREAFSADLQPGSVADKGSLIEMSMSLLHALDVDVEVVGDNHTLYLMLLPLPESE